MRDPVDRTVGKDLIEVAEQFRSIEPICAPLLSEPDRPSDKLEAVLAELLRLFSEIDSAIAIFLTTTLDDEMPAAQLRYERVQLEELTRPAPTGCLVPSRTACRRIYTLYERYLDPWFKSKLSGQDEERVKATFRLMYYPKGKAVAAIDGLTLWLRDRAATTLQSVNGRRWQEARNSIAQTRAELRPLRKALGDTIASLRALEARLIEEASAERR
jgi:hypothetical protein